MPPLSLRLQGGGGDGGVYPLTHTEQQWMAPSNVGGGRMAWSNQTKDRASGGTVRLDRAKVCAATSKPLQAPIVVDELGYLLNKEDVLELLLSRALPPHLGHIKSLKSLHDAKLHANPAYAAEAAAGHAAGRSEDDDEPPFYCPITQLPFNGRYPFVFIRPTGHVVSARALKQVGGSLCPVTEAQLTGAAAEVIPLNPSDEERKELEAALAARKAAASDAKRKLKEGKAKEAGSSAAMASADGTDSGAATSGSGSAGGGSGSAAAGGAMPTGGSSGRVERSQAATASTVRTGGGGGGGAQGAQAVGAKATSKRPRTEWEEVVAKRASDSAVYKSLFLSAADRKKQEEADSANFCARGIVPSINRSKFGLG